MKKLVTYWRDLYDVQSSVKWGAVQHWSQCSNLWLIEGHLYDVQSSVKWSAVQHWSAVPQLVTYWKALVWRTEQHCGVQCSNLMTYWKELVWSTEQHCGVQCRNLWHIEGHLYDVQGSVKWSVVQRSTLMQCSTVMPCSTVVHCSIGVQHCSAVQHCSTM